jgi:hypothetical protein
VNRCSRRLVLLVFGLAVGSISPMACAQYAFNHDGFQTGIGPTAVVYADFNGDHRPDLAIANSNDGTVSILLGKPDETFAPKVDYLTGSEPTALVSADFNGDGKLDLAVANASTQNVSVLLGNGDGTFQSHVDYAVGDYPVGLAAAVFTTSGHVDLAVPNWNDSTVAILLGKGDGTFQPQTLQTVASGPLSIATGDFNHDGKPDLITSSGGIGVVTVLLSQGDGQFSRVDTPLGISRDFTTAISGNFNSDTKLDAIVAARNAQQLFFLHGNGDGSFQSPIPLLNNLFASVTTVIAADFNHDGKLDVAASGYNTPGVVVVLGKGNGEFYPAIVSPAGEIDALSEAVDVNRDGAMDLTGVDATFNCVKILLGQGDGKFALPSSIPLPSGNYGIDASVVADFNGDGKLDVAVAEEGSPNGQVAVALGRGNGTFRKPIMSPLGGEAINNQDLLRVADFNGDGRSDLVILDDYTTGFSVSLGNGDGTFKNAVNTPLSYSILDLAAADFNGDAKSDIAVTNNGNGSQGNLNIFSGNGDGTFRTGSQYNVDLYSYVAAVDVNHDGKIDLVAAAWGSTLKVFLGNGDGTFQPPVVGPDLLYNTNLVFGDFNDDGRLDIAVGTYTGIAFLAGNGDGSFDAPVYSNAALLFCCQLVVGDVNGDGKLDLITNTGLGEPESMAGNGDGTFGPPVPYGAQGTVTPGNVDIGDFNSDGVDDIALVTEYTSAGNLITLYLSSPSVNLSRSELNFGVEQVGKTSAPQKIKLTDVGNSTLRISDITVSGDFLTANSCGKHRKIGQSCTISVSFKPKAKGERVGVLKVIDNASSSPEEVHLRGKGD